MAPNFSHSPRTASTTGLLHANELRESNDDSRSTSCDFSGTPADRASPVMWLGDYKQSSIAEKFSLSLAPASWGTPLLMGEQEPDDNIHNPEESDAKEGCESLMLSSRGFKNLGCLLTMILGFLVLFAGYPITSYVRSRSPSTQGGFNLGGINATGQIPELPGNFGLIDRDTPSDVYTKKSFHTEEDMVLVFSDEFDQDGRTFYPGDDPYWEAVNFHYWGTNDLEWYDPSQATTKGGYLQLTLERVDDPTTNHNMDYKSGMIQSWNKFCFTGGLIEASVRLPGSSSVPGLWPALWTMGNLGRAGYGASLEGTWPYSYDACDVGTLPNQTYPGTSKPSAAVTGGNSLSYLPGQRLSSCTCPGEEHPGPRRSDGMYVGRAAPEIDILEATIEDGVGYVSLSSQWGPFNAKYGIFNASGEVEYHQENATYNTYVGGVYQQTTSVLGMTNQGAYEMSGGKFAVYGFEYRPGFEEAYITWINDGVRSWTLYSRALAADSRVEISERQVSEEPMSIIANLGFSKNFVADIDFDAVNFPATMSIDYIRVYQPARSVNIGCDPEDHPTAAYIERFKEAYSNSNLTTWEQYGERWPKNRLLDGCQ